MIRRRLVICLLWFIVALSELLTPERTQRQLYRSRHEGIIPTDGMQRLQLVSDGEFCHESYGKWTGRRRGGWNVR